MNTIAKADRIRAAMYAANASVNGAEYQDRLYGLLSDYLRRTLTVEYGQDLSDEIYEGCLSSGENPSYIIPLVLADLYTSWDTQAHSNVWWRKTGERTANYGTFDLLSMMGDARFIIDTDSVVMEYTHPSEYGHFDETTSSRFYGAVES